MRPKTKWYLVFALTAVIAGSAFNFIFNPCGLGPEPQKVLPDSFFTTPSKDLSSLELLVDGTEVVEKIRHELMDAQSSVLIQVYIWKDDNIGRRLANNLKALAKKGVQVTVRKDMLGTFFELGDLIRCRPSPVFTRKGIRGHKNIDVRTDITADTDHSKYIMVDDRVTVFGGMNIADEYHLDWHDYMVIIHNTKWTQAFKDKVLRSQPWPHPSPFVITTNDRTTSEIRTAFVQVIDNAQRRIVIEHAYFSDDKIIEALERAAERDVRIDLILPEEPDTHVFANMVTINRLLSLQSKGSVRVFLYPRMSHAKVALVDGAIAAVGSANLTSRSMLRSREVTLFVHGLTDAPLIERLRDQLEHDMNESKQRTEHFQLSIPERVGAIAGKYIW